MWIKLNDKKFVSFENLSIATCCLFLTLAGLIAASLSFLQAIQVIKL